MKKIQFGLIVPATLPDKAQRASFIENLNRALSLISGHFDSFWMIDHLDEGETDLLESFTTLSYIAALHPRLKFGQTVICQSFRNPALLAKMGATLQFLSGGRFLLGIGAGWNAEEYRAYGYDFPPAKVRVEQLEEALQIIKAMWTQPQAAFAGRHYRVEAAHCEPRPAPVPPIMVGAFGPKMLRLTARYADGWNVSSVGPRRYRRLARAFEQACASEGRDPLTVTRSWSCCCACAPTQAEAESFTGGRYRADNQEDDFGFVGTPAQVIVQMQSFIGLGVDTFMVECGGFPRLTTLEMLIKEVIPVLNG